MSENLNKEKMTAAGAIARDDLAVGKVLAGVEMLVRKKYGEVEEEKMGLILRQSIKLMSGRDLPAEIEDGFWRSREGAAIKAGMSQWLGARARGVNGRS